MPVEGELELGERDAGAEHERFVRLRDPAQLFHGFEGEDRLEGPLALVDLDDQVRAPREQHRVRVRRHGLEHLAQRGRPEERHLTTERDRFERRRVGRQARRARVVRGGNAQGDQSVLDGAVAGATAEVAADGLRVEVAGFPTLAIVLGE